MLFYEQAAAGTLPAFSWISPKHEAADHPCLDLAKGERMPKEIFEALRGGKAWEKTLFVVTYDDYGGVCKCGNMWQPAGAMLLAAMVQEAPLKIYARGVVSYFYFSRAPRARAENKTHQQCHLKAI